MQIKQAYQAILNQQIREITEDEANDKRAISMLDTYRHELIAYTIPTPERIEQMHRNLMGLVRVYKDELAGISTSSHANELPKIYGQLTYAEYVEWRTNGIDEVLFWCRIVRKLIDNKPIKHE